MRASRSSHNTRSVPDVERKLPSGPASIVTIGYEGAMLIDLIRTLKKAGVSEVIDIRQRASSRRAGFSKTPLGNALHAAGISYRHIRSLGTPLALRRALKADQDYESFFKRFAEYLATRGQDLVELAQSTRGTFALLCFERDPRCCHRSRVAASLSTIMSATVIDLDVTKSALGSLI